MVALFGSRLNWAKAPHSISICRRSTKNWRAARGSQTREEGKRMDTFVILLVEDDPKDARLTIREIREVPLETRIGVARDGEEALDYLFRRGTHEGRAGNMPTL